MKKETQLFINQTCIEALEQYDKDTNCYLSDINFKRLDYCTAAIAEVSHYEVLISYQTLVAIYDRDNNTLYDVLRYVYGYTATSAKHIAKFRNMRCNATVLTYRDV